MGVALLTITCSNPLAKFLLSVPVTLCFAGLEVLILEGGMLLPGDTMFPLNWKLRHVHCEVLMPLTQQAKKGVLVLAGVIGPDYQGELGLLFYNGVKEEYVWNKGDPLDCLLVLPCPVNMVNYSNPIQVGLMA